MQTDGIKDIRFGEKKPWNFNNFVTLPLKIPEKTKCHPCKFHKIVLTKHAALLKFQDHKATPVSQKFFLIIEFPLTF